jgi:hypothetical protein
MNTTALLAVERAVFELTARFVIAHVKPAFSENEARQPDWLIRTPARHHVRLFFEKWALLISESACNHALLHCRFAYGRQSVTESVGFPHFKPRKNSCDHRRKMQNTRYRVQNTRLVDWHSNPTITWTINHGAELGSISRSDWLR